VDRRPATATIARTRKPSDADEAQNLLVDGRRAMTGSAPISVRRRSSSNPPRFHLVEGYGSTEAGIVYIDARCDARRDHYKLSMCRSGLFQTDQPYPRASSGQTKTCSRLLQAPESRRRVRSHGLPDRRRIAGRSRSACLSRRRNNVLKLSQGEFVTVSKLGRCSVTARWSEIYVYGNSALVSARRLVPTDDNWTKFRRRRALKRRSVSAAGHRKGRRLQSYEIPRTSLSRHTIHPGERPTDRHPQAGGQTEDVLRDRLECSTASLRQSGQRATRTAPAMVPTGRCWRPLCAPRAFAERLAAIWRPRPLQ